MQLNQPSECALRTQLGRGERLQLRLRLALRLRLQTRLGHEFRLECDVHRAGI